MASPLELRTLAALMAAGGALAILVAGEPAVLAAAAIVLAAGLAVCLAWRDLA